ncbi:ubiquitin carboxyl-terminal hydrolase 48 [Pelomyxa schiedti]|nr:ubiquitin carboxyl-terminal hydrolase 48 [Pelomyxa schiedti]
MDTGSKTTEQIPQLDSQLQTASYAPSSGFSSAPDAVSETTAESASAPSLGPSPKRMRPNTPIPRPPQPVVLAPTLDANQQRQQQQTLLLQLQKRQTEVIASASAGSGVAIGSEVGTFTTKLHGPSQERNGDSGSASHVATTTATTCTTCTSTTSTSSTDTSTSVSTSTSACGTKLGAERNLGNENRNNTSGDVCGPLQRSATDSGEEREDLSNIESVLSDDDGYQVVMRSKETKVTKETTKSRKRTAPSHSSPIKLRNNAEETIASTSKISVSLDNETLLNCFGLNQEPCTRARHIQACSSNPFCIQSIVGKNVTKTADKAFQKRIEEDDPSSNQRTIQYSGLENLGATCYMNSSLQALYHVSSFRQAVYKCFQDGNSAENTSTSSSKLPPDLATIGVELQKLFCNMQKSLQSSQSTKDFVNALHLSPQEQQDPDEFLKLFIPFLEKCFKSSHSTDLQDFVNTNFEGTVSMITKCRKCGCESIRKDAFLALGLNVKGMSTLDECITNSLSEEVLSGDNQYPVTDATRRAVLESLPSVFIVHLMRFVAETTSSAAYVKKKLRHQITFPYKMDVSKYIALPQAPHRRSPKSCSYNLFAIIIHKGASAQSGHYICLVKPEGSNSWFEFDDTDVTENEQITSLKAAGEDGIFKAESASNLKSTGAYLLFYTRADIPIVETPTPPTLLEQQIENENVAFRETLVQWSTVKDNAIQERKKQRRLYDKVVAGISEVAPLKNLSRGHWLSRAWIADYFCGDSTDARPISNKDILCPHGKATPTKVTDMRYIPDDAWEKMKTYFKGGPDLNVSNWCNECVTQFITDKSSKELTLAFRQELINKVKSIGSQTLPPGESMWISKEWLTEFQKKTVATSALLADINAAITCPHGLLTPVPTKRKLIPTDLWAQLYSIFQGGQSFAGSAESCPDCSREAHEKENQKKTLASQKTSAKKEFYKLLENDFSPAEAINQSATCFLIPQVWIGLWKEWLGDKDIEVLPPLTTQHLLCEHGNLLYSPAHELSFASVTAEAWRRLTKKYAENCTRPIEVEVGTDSKLRFNPPVCEPCRRKRLEREEDRRIHFTDTIFRVVCKGRLNSAGKSRARSTRTSSTQLPIKVSYNTTLQELKLKIFQANEEYFPMRQQIKSDSGAILTGDSNTLLDLKIRESTKLEVYFTEEAPQDQVPESASHEVGFKGTKLLDTASKPPALPPPSQQEPNLPPPSTTTTTQPTQPTPTDTASAEPPPWNCPKCTYANHGALHTCELCNTGREDNI